MQLHLAAFKQSKRRHQNLKNNNFDSQLMAIPIILQRIDAILNRYIFIQSMNEWTLIRGVSYKSKHVFNNFHVNDQRLTLSVWAGWYMTLKFTPSCHVANDEWGWIKIKLISRFTLTTSKGNTKQIRMSWRIKHEDHWLAKC